MNYNGMTYGGYPYTNNAVPDQLAMYRAQQYAPPQQPPAHPQGNSGLLWVQGEAGAKSFLLAPGQTVMLMDSEDSVFYIKTADASGMPMPLRVFDYRERTTAQTTAPITNDTNRFVTREEFNELLEKIKMGAVSNGEQIISGS